MEGRTGRVGGGERNSDEVVVGRRGVREGGRVKRVC